MHSGGSVVAELLSQENVLFKPQNINIVVRSGEQAQSVATLGVNVLEVNLSDGKAVAEAVLNHKGNRTSPQTTICVLKQGTNHVSSRHCHPHCRIT